MITTLSYKGYLGSVEYSHEDTVFHGKLLGIKALITFESDTAKGLEPAFHYMVDDYLQFCKEENIKPEKVFKGNFNVRISPQLHERLYYSSLKENKSINKVLVERLEKSYA